MSRFYVFLSAGFVAEGVPSEHWRQWCVFLLSEACLRDGASQCRGKVFPSQLLQVRLLRHHPPPVLLRLRCWGRYEIQTELKSLLIIFFILKLLISYLYFFLRLIINLAILINISSLFNFLLARSFLSWDVLCYTTQWDIVVWDRGTISLHHQPFFINYSMSCSVTSHMA